MFQDENSRHIFLSVHDWLVARAARVVFRLLFGRTVCFFYRHPVSNPDKPFGFAGAGLWRRSPKQSGNCRTEA
jgi:hypothetical protein